MLLTGLILISSYRWQNSLDRINRIIRNICIENHIVYNIRCVQSYHALPSGIFVFMYFRKGLFPSGNFPMVFSQVATYQMCNFAKMF